MPPPAIGVALLVGAVNGVLIAYAKMPPFVVTLGMLSVARSLAMVLSQNKMIYEFGPDHDFLLWLGGGSTFGLPHPLIVAGRARDLSRRLPFAGCAGANIYSPSAAMNRRRY